MISKNVRVLLFSSSLYLKLSSLNFIEDLFVKNQNRVTNMIRPIPMKGPENPQTKKKHVPRRGPINDPILEHISTYPMNSYLLL